LHDLSPFDLGSTRLITGNDTSDVEQRRDYKPFGDTQTSSGNDESYPFGEPHLAELKLSNYIHSVINVKEDRNEYDLKKTAAPPIGYEQARTRIPQRAEHSSA
jgi:hypothetical protein